MVFFHDEWSVTTDESDPSQHMSLFQLWVGIQESDRTQPPRFNTTPVFLGLIASGKWRDTTLVTASIMWVVTKLTRRRLKHLIPLMWHHYAQTCSTNWFPLDPSHDRRNSSFLWWHLGQRWRYRLRIKDESFEWRQWQLSGNWDDSRRFWRPSRLVLLISPWSYLVLILFMKRINSVFL